MSNLRLTSPAFGDGASIPAIYTCQGSNSNPPLEIANIPVGAQSLALTVDDPDAPSGVWDHWVVWNIAPTTTKIPEGSVPDGAMQGVNSSGMHSYQGPCPPSGTHRYRFTVYAVSDVLSLSPNVGKAAMLQAIEGKVLDQHTLTGLYQKHD